MNSQRSVWRNALISIGAIAAGVSFLAVGGLRLRSGDGAGQPDRPRAIEVELDEYPGFRADGEIRRRFVRDQLIYVQMVALVRDLPGSDLVVTRNAIWARIDGVDRGFIWDRGWRTNDRHAKAIGLADLERQCGFRAGSLELLLSLMERTRVHACSVESAPPQWVTPRRIEFLVWEPKLHQSRERKSIVNIIKPHPGNGTFLPVVIERSNEWDLVILPRPGWYIDSVTNEQLSKADVPPNQVPD